MYRGGLVTGTLKGYDALMNLVLDDGKETVRGTSLRSTLSHVTIPKTHLMMLMIIGITR